MDSCILHSIWTRAEIAVRFQKIPQISLEIVAIQTFLVDRKYK